MSQLTDSDPTAATSGGAAAPRVTTPVGAFLVGVVTAGLGLGVCTVSVLLLWIAAPAPAGGPAGALHVAADLWLFAHGANLERTAGAGAAVPVGVTPLLLVAVPVWLLYRCAQHALAGAADGRVPRQAGSGTGPRAAPLRAAAPGAVLGRFLGGYLLVAAVAVAYAATGPLRVDPFSALLFVPLTAAGTVAMVAARTVGLRTVLPPSDRLRRIRAALPPGVRAALARPRRAAALRAACAAGAVLLATGALLVLTGLVWHAGDVHHGLLRIAQDWPGRCTVVLVCLLLLPNAAVWGAAYALGPGFTLGGGSAVGPLGATALPAGLPPFPLLGAVPQEGPGSPLTWAVAAGPVVAGAVAARYAARPARAAVAGVRDAARHSGDEPAGQRRARAAVARLLRWNRRATATVAALAALWCGVGAAVLSGVAGGALGTAALRHVGPSWWLTGAAAAGWTAAVAVPGALLLREWYLWRGLGRSPLAQFRAYRSGRGQRREARAERREKAAAESRAAAQERAVARAERKTRRSDPAHAPRRDVRADGERKVRLRGVRLRRRTGTGTGATAHPWHETGSRRTRWAELRRVSGGLGASVTPGASGTSEASDGSAAPDGRATPDGTGTSEGPAPEWPGGVGGPGMD
ncbi:DUF6350 family protein [Streptomyces sp. NPDC042319]|uniref:cell division protein PerM n=1 Tax=Streptomyces sp. NPDC042319 TaxID=3154332 RepID=UPI0033CF6CB2